MNKENKSQNGTPENNNDDKKDKSIDFDNIVNPSKDENNNQNEIDLLNEKLNQKETESNSWQDKYLRLYADFDNARKRWDRDKEQIIKFANYSFLQESLVVLDEIGEALKVCKIHNNVEDINKGLEMLYNNFKNILKKQGLQEIEALGKIFDPHVHEMVASRQITDEKTEEHTILEEVQKGYLLEGKVLRTAKVIVGVKKK